MKTIKEASEALGLSKWAIYKAIQRKTELGLKFRNVDRLGLYMIPTNSLKSLVGKKNG